MPRVCYCVVGGEEGVQAERHNSQCVFFPSMLISPCRTDIPAWCVRCFRVVSVTVPRFSHTQEDFNHIPLSCCLTRWTSIIVANFPPRLWTPPTHPTPLVRPSIHQVSLRHKTELTQEFFLGLMTLF